MKRQTVLLNPMRQVLPGALLSLKCGVEHLELISDLDAYLIQDIEADDWPDEGTVETKRYASVKPLTFQICRCAVMSDIQNPWENEL